MNKVMYGENRRRGGRNTLCRLLRSGRWFLCLALHCSVMLPGFASADDWNMIKRGCADWSGNPVSVMLKLPPSISFAPEQSLAPGSILYTSPDWYAINYKCKTDLPNERPALTRLADSSPLLNKALNDAGVKLQILIAGEDKPWEPATDEFVRFGSSYNKETGKQTLRLKAQLVVTKRLSSGFYAVPSLSAFKLIAYYGAITSQGLGLNTPAVRIQYVPTCFVKTSLDTNKINFGPVMKTDVDSKFSREPPFVVRAEVNMNCNNGNLMQPYKVYLQNQLKGTYYLELPLKVSFMLNNGGIVSGDRKSIILDNTEGKRNGLQLQITGDRGPVTFGEISTSDGTPPANQFGEFQGSDSGGTWNIKNTYHAVLSSTGEPVITGIYNAQVTVKVEYY